MAALMQGKVLVAGSAQGELLYAAEPLSFWGGYDPASGEVIDRRHPLSGAIAAGRVLAIPASRGSSTTAAVLLEAVRAGTAPAAILTAGVDTFLALAAIVADELYGRALPVVALAPADFARLAGGGRVRIAADGHVELDDATPA